MNQPDYKALSRGQSSDMSPEAILHRLKIVDELHELGNFLTSGEFGEPVRVGVTKKVEYAAESQPPPRTPLSDHSEG